MLANGLTWRKVIELELEVDEPWEDVVWEGGTDAGEGELVGRVRSTNE